MNRTEENLASMLSKAFPASTPTSELESRIFAGAAQRRTVRPMKLAFLALSGAFVLAGIIFVAPKAVAYTEFQRMEAAADALPQWHMKTFTPDINGKLVQSGETWCANGHVRNEREFGNVVVLSAGNSVIEYHKGEDHAIEDRGSDASKQLKRLSGMLHEFQRTTTMLNTNVEHDVIIEGRRATRVSALELMEPVRISLYADPQTDIPFLGIVEQRVGHGWRVERRIEIDGTTGIRSNKIPGLPSTIKVVERSDLQKHWQDALRSPIAEYPRTRTTKVVAIRDIWVNSEGLVFVMFTNGNTQRPTDMSKWKTLKGPGGQIIRESPSPVTAMLNSPELESIEDDLGTTYSRLNGFQGVMMNTTGEFLRGLRWPEGDAQVQVFAPNLPQVRPPTHVTLTFGNTVYKVPKGFKPKGNFVSVSEMVPVHTISATHVQAVKPHQGKMPEWVSVLGMDSTPLGLGMEVARVRAVAAIQRGDGESAETYAGQHLRLAQLEMAQSGFSYAMYGFYDLLGQAYCLRGKTDLAVELWTKALNDAKGDDRLRINNEIDRRQVIPR